MNEDVSGIDKLVGALIEAQAEIRPIQLNAENPFLHSKYADLGSHIEGIMPALRKHGLTVTQLVFGEGGSIGVETVLAHTSGQRLSSKISLPVVDEKGKSGAQVAGSIVSYLRRYALAAIVGAYSGDDDDAAVPIKKTGPTVARKELTTRPQAVNNPAAPKNAKDWTAFYKYADSLMDHDSAKKMAAQFEGDAVAAFEHVKSNFG